MIMMYPVKRLISCRPAWKIPGVLGSRITGGGFGGCTVSIVKDESVDTFIETIGKTYLEKVGHEAEFYTVDIETVLLVSTNTHLC